MKINSISATYSGHKNSKLQNSQTNQKTNNDFQFTYNSSKAIASITLAGISFKGRSINTPEARRREFELLVDAFNVYANVMQVFKNTVPECAKEAKELYQLASKDLKNATSDKCLTLDCTIHNGKIVPHKLLRSDRLGQPIYSADFSKGKISQINEFDMFGNISKTIKFKEETGDLISYQKNSTDAEYEFLIEYDSEYGIAELSKYSAEPTKDNDGNINHSMVIDFVNSELKYRENVVTTPQGDKIEAKRIFNFENLSTFDYCSSIQNGIKQGEKIRIENSNMTSWE